MRPMGLIKACWLQIEPWFILEGPHSSLVGSALENLLVYLCLQKSVQPVRRCVLTAT